MAEKSILVAGIQVPIHLPPEKNVFVYNQAGGMNFYTPTDFLSASQLAQMAALRPTMRNYSFRRSSGGTLFSREVNQLYDVPRAELDAFGDTVIQLAIHHDVTPNAKTTFNVLCTRGLSTHFCVNYNGDLYQYLDCYHCAWATGDNNNRCVAIDLNNPVFTDVQYDGPRRDVFQGKVNGSLKTMLGYTEEQYDTFIALIKAFITPVPMPGQEPWIPLPNVAKNCFPPVDRSGKLVNRLLANHLSYVGFLGHFHCSANKWDPGPAMDWFRVLSGLKGERNSFPFILTNDGGDGPNIGNLTGQSLSTRFEEYYQNADMSDGGWYPIGVNQSWHSGIHLNAPEGTPVLNMSSGTIVAVRSTFRVNMGDPSFVLVRHDKQIPDPKGGRDPAVLHWYSLYMHLQEINDETAPTLPWLDKLTQGSPLRPTNLDVRFADGDKNNRVPEVFNASKPGTPVDEIKRALYQGKIIITNIEVKAEERLGSFGMFYQGSAYNPQDIDQDDLTRCIHLECFSEQNIFQKQGESPQETEAWTVVEGDESTFSLVKVRKIIGPIKEFISYNSPTGDVGKFLKSSEIASFFHNATDEKYPFRQMICYHRSEWSPTMNWTKTAVINSGWQWQTEANFGKWLLAYLPFQWMTEEVVSALKIKTKTSSFYTYHPLYMLQQLNSTYSEVVLPNAQAASDTEISENLQENRKRLDEIVALNKKINSNQSLTPEETERYRELYTQMDDHLDDQNGDISKQTDYQYNQADEFSTWEPGEWPIPSDTG